MKTLQHNGQKSGKFTWVYHLHIKDEEGKILPLTNVPRFTTRLEEGLISVQGMEIHFSSRVVDPLLPETVWLTQQILYVCMEHQVPVKISTSDTEWVDRFLRDSKVSKEYITIEFVSKNSQESKSQELSMEKLRKAGFVCVSTTLDYEKVLETT